MKTEIKGRGITQKTIVYDLFINGRYIASHGKKSAIEKLAKLIEPLQLNDILNLSHAINLKLISAFNVSRRDIYNKLI